MGRIYVSSTNLAAGNFRHDPERAEQLSEKIERQTVFGTRRHDRARRVLPRADREKTGRRRSSRSRAGAVSVQFTVLGWVAWPCRATFRSLEHAEGQEVVGAGVADQPEARAALETGAFDVTAVAINPAEHKATMVAVGAMARD